MKFASATWLTKAGQDDMRPSLRVPMVYERVQASRVCWEYRVLSVDAREEALPVAAQFDELGSEGWLLTTILEESIGSSGRRYHYHFVREKLSEA